MVAQPLQSDFPKNTSLKFLLSILVEHEKVGRNKIFLTTCGYHGYQIKMADTKYYTMWQHKFLING